MELELDMTLAVAIPTFRRPALLLQALSAVAAQDHAGTFPIVVGDNDARGREGEAAARRWAAGTGAPAADCPLRPLRTIVVAEQGLSACRNALLHEAFADPAVQAVAMVDDDSFPEASWLRCWSEFLAHSPAQVCGGPTLYRFPDAAPEVVRHCAMFAAPHQGSGPVPMLRSSNNLVIRRAAWERMGPEVFSLAFNTTGGEDTDFFHRARSLGLPLAWCASAVVHEPLPPARCTTDWVLQRCRLSACNRARVEMRYGASAVGQVLRAGRETLTGGARLLSSSADVRFLGRMRIAGAAGRINALQGRTHRHGA